jgi:hypothetical protein
MSKPWQALRRFCSLLSRGKPISCLQREVRLLLRYWKSFGKPIHTQLDCNRNLLYSNSNEASVDFESTADARDVAGFPHHCLMFSNLLMFEAREVGFDDKVQVEQG